MTFKELKKHECLRWIGWDVINVYEKGTNNHIGYVRVSELTEGEDDEVSFITYEECKRI